MLTRILAIPGLVLLLACGSTAVPESSPLTAIGPAADGGTPTEGCQQSPLSIVAYQTLAQLQELLVRRWQRCSAPQARGEDVGVEFTADGRWYALTRDRTGTVIRRQGIDYGGKWQYFPPGSMDPISRQPSQSGFLILDEVITSPPVFTNDPRQLRILFSPILSVYVPL